VILAGHPAQIDGAALDAQAARLQLGHAQELAHESAQAARLAGDEPGEALDHRRRQLPHPLLQALDAELEGGDGGVELVRGDGEEIVAQADGLAGLAVQAGVVQGQGGAAGQLLAQGQVALVVAAPAGTGHQGHGAEQALVRPHGQDHARAHPDLAGQPHGLGIAEVAAHLRLDGVGHQHGAEVGAHLQRLQGSAQAILALAQLEEQLLLALDRRGRRPPGGPLPPRRRPPRTSRPGGPPPAATPPPAWPGSRWIAARATLASDRKRTAASARVRSSTSWVRPSKRRLICSEVAICEESSCSHLHRDRG
jgi:hypothetical protein